MAKFHGFVVLAVFILGRSTAQECGYTVNVTDGETVFVTSPNYPENYPNNADCLWRVHATDLSHLSLSCPELDIQGSIFGCVDTLSFSDVENFNQQPSYCGSRKPPAVLGFGDTVFMQFLSDGSGSNKGFNCSLTAKKLEEDPDCECGLANKRRLSPQQNQGKIWNGSPIGKHEYPWLAFIQVADTSPATVICGAAVISSHYVLTSARCIIGFNPNSIRVRVGEHDLMNENEFPPHKVHDIEAVKVHPEFNITSLSNDLALIRLGEEILFGANMRPACLPEGPLELESGVSVTAAGWGPTATGGQQVTLPRETMLDIDPPTPAECSSRLPSKYAVGAGQFCTTTLDGSDVCTGDFGGPITLRDANGMHTLAGISSFNTECGNLQQPTVHSRVDFYKSWILAETADSIKCSSKKLTH